MPQTSTGRPPIPCSTALENSEHALGLGCEAVAKFGRHRDRGSIKRRGRRGQTGDRMAQLVRAPPDLERHRRRGTITMSRLEIGSPDIERQPARN